MLSYESWLDSNNPVTHEEDLIKHSFDLNLHIETYGDGNAELYIRHKAFEDEIFECTSRNISDFMQAIIKVANNEHDKIKEERRC